MTSKRFCFVFSIGRSYELMFQRLIKNTDIEHPDQNTLQEALKLVHDILLHLDCKKREALENDQREATLRDLEVWLFFSLYLRYKLLFFSI